MQFQTWENQNISYAYHKQYVEKNNSGHLCFLAFFSFFFWVLWKKKRINKVCLICSFVWEKSCFYFLKLQSIILKIETILRNWLHHIFYRGKEIQWMHSKLSPEARVYLFVPLFEALNSSTTWGAHEAECKDCLYLISEDKSYSLIYRWHLPCSSGNSSLKDFKK